jgi:hypothetical protein
MWPVLICCVEVLHLLLQSLIQTWVADQHVCGEVCGTACHALFPGNAAAAAAAAAMLKLLQADTQQENC